MYCSYILVACGVVGTANWKHLESMYDTVFPEILKTFSRLPFGNDLRDEYELRKRLNAYNAMSIPMYYRCLSEDPKLTHFTKIALMVDEIGVEQRLFLPFAFRALELRRNRVIALRFITSHANRDEISKVAQILIQPPNPDSEYTRLILMCLSARGGKRELEILDQFLNKSIAETPKAIWQQEVDECKNAILKRLEKPTDMK